MGDRTDGEWRCRSCGTLLGVERQGRMHLKYKMVQYVVTGTVTAVCRRCTETSEITCPRAPTAAASGRAA